jgi:hypothetical protein
MTEDCQGRACAHLRRGGHRLALQRPPRPAYSVCNPSPVATLRWDGDDRGEGVGDATAFVAGAAELTDAMRHATWVAERPEVHLLPHVERACESLPLQLLGTSTSKDGTFELRLSCTQADASVGEVRAAVFAVLGCFAETATYVRQRRVDAAEAPGEALLFEIVTGFLASDTAFAPHGHTVRVSVSNA